MKVRLHIHPIDLVVGYSVLHCAYMNVQRLCDIVYFLVVSFCLGVQESEPGFHGAAAAAAAAEGMVKMQRWKMRISETMGAIALQVVLWIFAKHEH